MREGRPREIKSGGKAVSLYLDPEIIDKLNILRNKYNEVHPSDPKSLSSFIRNALQAYVDSSPSFIN